MQDAEIDPIRELERETSAQLRRIVNTPTCIVEDDLDRGLDGDGRVQDDSFLGRRLARRTARDQSALRRTTASLRRGTSGLSFVPSPGPGGADI